jgi:multidrug efflux pump
MWTDLFIKRPVLSIVVSILILLAGAVSLFMLPIRQYPNLQSATITINTTYPGATQDVIQGFVTTPIAQAIATVNGIEYMTSTSMQGNSLIKAKLVINADADRAMTEVLAKVQQVKYLLPANAFDPVISKITDGSSAIQYINFTGESMTIPQVTDFVTRVAQPLLTSISGVASAEIVGGQAIAMRVWLDPDKLAARGLTAGDITAALRANNVQAAPGQLKNDNTIINITAATDATDILAFREMVIKRGPASNQGIVRLRDVATLELGGQNYNSSVRARHRPSVGIALSPTPDGNPIDIVASAKKLIPEMQKLAPPGLSIESTFDVTHFVNASISEVEHTLLEAVVIVVLVIFLFLGSLRAVVIPIVTIPLSMVGTAALMLALGFSINLLTLLAMVLAIGLVVDDAIVVVENIHRHIEDGLSPIDAALIGAREIVGPVIAMTITLAAVYAPIGMMGGMTGSLFKEFAFTLAGSVCVSGVIALTLSPMMSSRLLKSDIAEGWFAQMIEHTFTSLARRYSRLVEVTLAYRSAVLLVAVILLAATAAMFFVAQKELAPQEDQGYVFAAVKAPQYANIDYTARATKQVEDIFSTLPEYHSSFFVNGTEGQNRAFGGVILTDWAARHRSSTDIQNELYARMNVVHDASVTPFQPTALPAATEGLPFQVVLRSAGDFRLLFEEAEKLKAAIYQSGLFVFVDSDLAFDNPAAHMKIDISKAGELGITMQAIADTLNILVGENYVNRFNYFSRSYDVIPQVRQAHRLTPEKLGGYYVRTASDQLVPMSTVVKVDVFAQPNKLSQFNQMNSALLSAVIRPGVTMGQAVAFIEEQPLAPGVSIDWMADSRQYVKEGSQLTISFGLALVVIFLVLAAQYESFRDPLVILVTVPLAMFGALIPLFLDFTTVNIYTQIGLVTLIGLISKHGILMVAFANEIQAAKGHDRHAAIVEAASVRMRPILMTTAAMVAGLVPLIFANGAGAASRFAIGIVVVMGMLIGTLFTLFVLPTFYTLIAKDHRPSRAINVNAVREETGRLAADGARPLPLL